LYAFEMTTALTSPHNPLLKEVRRAASHGGLTSAGCAVAEGRHLLEEALASRVEIHAVIAAEGAVGAVQSMLSRAPETHLVSVPDELFGKIASTEHPQGVITLVRPPRWSCEDMLRSIPLIVILDGIQDPGNAGAIVRAGEAFEATGVVFRKGTVSPHNPKCLRASAGSLFRVPVAQDLNPANVPGLTLFAAMPRAERTLDQADFRGPCAIVVGSEGGGVAPGTALEAVHVRIPTAGVESLNAAMAAGVMLYEAHRQRTRA
jgi:RNA methyltransferase, TrmH family